MAVKIIAPGEQQLFTLTSPPNKLPDIPDKEIIWKTNSYKDRDVTVTVPFPDKITLVSEVLEHHVHHPPMGKTHEQKYKQVDKDLQEWTAILKGEGGHIQGPQKVYGGDQVGAMFFVPYGPELDLRAHLTVRRLPKKKLHGNVRTWTLRLEFNPSRAGPAGLVKLTALVSEYVAGAINFTKMLPDMRVTRLDAAIDCIGVSPLDLIAHIDKPGKRLVYVGEVGRPETIYHYALKAKSLKQPTSSTKTTGPLRLKIYDKLVECKERGLPLPYGDVPTTRVEATKIWKNGNKNPLLVQLAAVTNIFLPTRVAYAPHVANYRRDWRSFCMAVFGVGIEGATRSPPELRMATRYKACAGDLLDASCWAEWHRGLAITGMEALITDVAK